MLVQQSLALLEDQVWASLAPWASAPPPWAAPSAAPSLSGLQLRLQVSGERGACDAPLSWAATGRGAAGWAHSSTPSCGGEPVALHVFTCASCALDLKSAVSAAFHFSCQSMLLEALAVPAHPAASTSARAAPLNETVAPPGRRLASVEWTLGVALSLLQDNTTAPPFTAAGYLLSSQVLEVATAAWAAQPGGGALLLVQPASAAVRVTVSMPLQPFVVTTTLTPQVPLFTLFANLVGLAGALGLFSFVFGCVEDLDRSKAGYKQSFHKMTSRWKAGRGDGGKGDSGGADAPLAEGAAGDGAPSESEAEAVPEGDGPSAAAPSGGLPPHPQRPPLISERHDPAALPGAAAAMPPSPAAAAAAGAPSAGPPFFSLVTAPGISPPPPAERPRSALFQHVAAASALAGAEKMHLRSPRHRESELEAPSASHAHQRADGDGASRWKAWESESEAPAVAGALGSRSPRSGLGGAPAAALLLAASPQRPLQGPELPGSSSSAPQRPLRRV